MSRTVYETQGRAAEIELRLKGGLEGRVRLSSVLITHCYFFFSSRRRHTRLQGDWSSDVCSSDLQRGAGVLGPRGDAGMSAALQAGSTLARCAAARAEAGGVMVYTLRVQGASAQFLGGLRPGRHVAIEHADASGAVQQRLYSITRYEPCSEH